MGLSHVGLSLPGGIDLDPFHLDTTNLEFRGMTDGLVLAAGAEFDAILNEYLRIRKNQTISLKESHVQSLECWSFSHQPEWKSAHVRHRPNMVCRYPFRVD